MSSAPLHQEAAVAPLNADRCEIRCAPALRKRMTIANAAQANTEQRAPTRRTLQADHQVLEIARWPGNERREPCAVHLRTVCEQCAHILKRPERPVRSWRDEERIWLKRQIDRALGGPWPTQRRYIGHMHDAARIMCQAQWCARVWSGRDHHFSDAIGWIETASGRQMGGQVLPITFELIDEVGLICAIPTSVGRASHPPQPTPHGDEL